MEQFYGKKYKLKTSENFDEFMKYIEIGFLSRKTAAAVSPVASLSSNPNGTLTLSLRTVVRNLDITFRPGVEFDEERADGVKVKSLMVIEGNKLIQTQVEENGRKSTHVREFTSTLLTVISTAEGWDKQCIRTYEAID